MKINFNILDILLLFIVFVYTISWSQVNSTTVGDHDVIGPQNSSFKLGQKKVGDIQNTINEVTGKIAFSVPIANISAGTVNYDLSINYDGQSSFRTGSELNKYNPTSIIGVGWDMPLMKITVDNKDTATRDDDDFYFSDGSTVSKLICTERGNETWEFEMEEFANWDITYYKGFTEFAQNPITGMWSMVYREADFWKIINDEGIEYYLGYATNQQNGVSAPSSTSKSKEVVSTWGNWIGDSNKNPNGVSTIVWNVSRIRDQWDNQLNFSYDLVEGRQNTSQTNHKHTEASYLRKIISSNGSRVLLNYGNKQGALKFEYHEPHRERTEPDAYQERYEKKFLSNVEVYNYNIELSYSFDFGYQLKSLHNDDKRYLTNITQSTHTNGTNASLPPQTFDYHYSGTFRGGLKTITYPSGGSVTYNYQNKSLFYNNSTTHSGISGYYFYAAKVSDNYNFRVYRSIDPIGNSGKYRLKIQRFTWNGKDWESNIFTFPHLVALHGDGRLRDFYGVYENDFYGFAFDTGVRADLFLFHKEQNGRDWKYTRYSSNHIGNEKPVLLSGDNFIALGSHHTGRLWIRTWNGKTWNSKLILQGGGQYYYAATNNFILSLDEDGGSDMITGASHEDNYYIHYLDAEKEWQTKSWSAFADPRIHGIELPSYFYPSNSMSGFVADDNPELFLRWNKDYNLVAVDDNLGMHNDSSPLLPSGNSGLFSLLNHFYSSPIQARRFNGIDWSSGNVGSSQGYYSKTNFGQDFLTFQNHPSLGLGYLNYDPNFDAFNSGTLTLNSGVNSNETSNGITSEYIVVGNLLFKKNTGGGPTFLFNQAGSIGNVKNNFTYTDGISQSYIKRHTNTFSSTFIDAMYLNIDKSTGLINQINLGKKIPIMYYTNWDGKNKVFGGSFPFLSQRTMHLKSEPSAGQFDDFLYRIIDNGFNNWVRDIVVTSINMDDDNGNVRKINYTYNDATPSSDNEITFYGEVVIENKGFGASSNGRVKKIYNAGAYDVQMAGLLLEEQILDTNNNIKAKTTNTWNKIEKNYGLHGMGHDVVLKTEKQEVFLPSGNLVNTTDYNYNSDGLITSSTTTNSNGETESQHIRYAYQQYTFVRDKNMMNEVYEMSYKVDNETIGIEQNVWINSGNRVYLKEKWSGSNASNLRMKTDLTRIDNNGVPLEETNGKDVYVSRLLGYSDRYEVAKITNATYQDVINELDVTYSQLQTLNTESLKNELMKLYDRLPDTMITLNFYDNNGRIVNIVNERKEEAYRYYDIYGRLDYVTDGYGNILSRKAYNFGN